MNIKYVTIALLLCLGLGARAQGDLPLPILTNSLDARTQALGGNHYGLARSAYLYTNPSSALYGSGEKLSIALLGHAQRLDNEQRNTLSTLGATMAYHFGGHALMAGARYQGGISVQEVSPYEIAGRTKRLYDYTLDLGYALRLGHFSAFATGSYVYSYQTRATATYVFGLGLSYHDAFSLSGQKVRYTLTAKGRNLGRSFAYIQGGTETQPPLSIGLGGSMETLLSREHTLGLGAGVEHFALSGDAATTLVRLGGEYAWRDTLMARVGYVLGAHGLGGLSLGLGGRYHVVCLDVAYSLPREQTFAPTLSLSLGLSF